MLSSDPVEKARLKMPRKNNKLFVSVMVGGVLAAGVSVWYIFLRSKQNTVASSSYNISKELLVDCLKKCLTSIQENIVLVVRLDVSLMEINIVSPGSDV